MDDIHAQATALPPADTAKIQTQVSEPLTLVGCMFLLAMLHICLIDRPATGVFLHPYASNSLSGKTIKSNNNMTIALMSHSPLQTYHL